MPGDAVAKYSSVTENIASNRKITSKKIENIYDIAAAAEELFFSGFSLAVAAFNLTAWTLAALPILLLLTTPLAFLKIVKGFTEQDRYLAAMDIGSGVAHLAGIAAIPSVSASLVGLIPACLILPSLTLPWVGIAVSELITLGSLLYKYKNSPMPTNQLKNEIMHSCIRVTALLFFAAGAAFSAPAIGFSVTAVGIFCGFSLGYRYCSYQLNFFKSAPTSPEDSYLFDYSGSHKSKNSGSLSVDANNPDPDPDPDKATNSPTVRT